MRILEKWGLRKTAYFYGYFKRKSCRGYHSVEELFGGRILYIPVVAAFVVGFALTLPVVWFETVEPFRMEWQFIAAYLLILLASVFLEFYFLFLLGFATLGYYICQLYRIGRAKHRVGENDFRVSLVRTAMELPQKKIISYNVDPYEYREKKILILSLLYKAKVILTTFVAKFLFRKLLGRTALRGYSALIAAPVTGIWDAAVFWQTMRRTQYKLTVRFVIRHMLLKKSEQLVAHTKLIQLRYYYMDEYDGNLSYLLQHIYKTKPFDYVKEEYLAVDLKKQNLKLFALIFAFKHTMFTSREKHLSKEVGVYEEIKILQHALRNANLTFLESYVETL